MKDDVAAVSQQLAASLAAEAQKSAFAFFKQAAVHAADCYEAKTGIRLPLDFRIVEDGIVYEIVLRAEIRRVGREEEA